MQSKSENLETSVPELKANGKEQTTSNDDVSFEKWMDNIVYEVDFNDKEK